MLRLPGVAFYESRLHNDANITPDTLRAMERDNGGHHVVRLQGIEEGVEVSRRLAASVRRFLSGSGRLTDNTADD